MPVLLLDAYHLGDPLFLGGLARDLAARAATGADGLVLVHGSGERGERALEALGLAPTATDGVWDAGTDEQAAAVERATRELNREVAHELNEAGVASVRVVGADRGLLKAGGGSVIATKTNWLAALVRQRVVAVVAALVGGGGGPAPRGRRGRRRRRARGCAGRPARRAHARAAGRRVARRRWRTGPSGRPWATRGRPSGRSRRAPAWSPSGAGALREGGRAQGGDGGGPTLENRRFFGRLRGVFLDTSRTGGLC